MKLAAYKKKLKDGGYGPPQTSLAVYNLEYVQPYPVCLVTPQMIPLVRPRALRHNERVAVRQPAADKVVYDDDLDEVDE